MKAMPVRKLVGASLLAMDVNDNACLLDKRVVLRSFASKLAPTGDAVTSSILAASSGRTQKSPADQAGLFYVLR
jgi:hypothetical protein